ncbi:Protein pxr1 [Penicillium maclennaniae]|uniref:Protein pxr1 n=1 Tax=Penicillium maclennaniae TaxID=1343394 RepID=UPI00254159A3|nr:Protein pxr1 [Penicillium maclennaniae]KAJ5674855.1 Protein pxr1 [Penicillium maclennaniae]
MSAQGWTPGNRLGAENAAHADFLTSASTSHIKVTLKDDNLGLGARAGREGEPTGLDAFKGLLGRLNGKSEGELKQDERKREDVKLARYVAMKFPEVRFVRGGLLVQEKLEALPKKAEAKSVENATSEEADSSSSDSSALIRKSSNSKSTSNSKTTSKSKSKSKSSKKYHSEEEADDSSESKKKKKSRKRKAEADDETMGEQQLQAPIGSSSPKAMVAKVSTCENAFLSEGRYSEDGILRRRRKLYWMTSLSTR